ncbi:hypothetical protein Pan241w_39820 [Gimesia alba]|uniref:Branched-chain amino acid aminotransferase n=1 Tax=Gimesia alba TaxID=2527973 RepID=A0A517RJ28_9PLAN|nr:hypothetical protein [Gimesia alba]QDT43878.1 hypothetical protein Pan241w_39820 [Gimesia alba]
MINQFWKEEAGFIIASELVLILTIGCMAMIVGLSQIAVAVNTELNDLSNAFGSFNQSYVATGFEGNDSLYLGSMFLDTVDDCDLNTTCDLLIPASRSSSEGGILR